MRRGPASNHYGGLGAQGRQSSIRYQAADIEVCGRRRNNSGSAGNRGNAGNVSGNRRNLAYNQPW